MLPLEAPAWFIAKLDLLSDADHRQGSLSFGECSGVIPDAGDPQCLQALPGPSLCFAMVQRHAPPGPVRPNPAHATDGTLCLKLTCILSRCPQALP